MYASNFKIKVLKKDYMKHYENVCRVFPKRLGA